MNKKVLTLVLALSLIVSLLTGCGSAPAQQSQAPAGNETAAPAENAEPQAVSRKV